VHAPDAFYDPPAHVPSLPGALLRSEPLRDVTLPPGMQGWRILYTTTVDDSTPATAVATVFAPVDSPAGPRPVIMWEHGKFAEADPQSPEPVFSFCELSPP
jgi:hypothetical protein